jgi:hypothetical protein
LALPVLLAVSRYLDPIHQELNLGTSTKVQVNSRSNNINACNYDGLDMQSNSGREECIQNDGAKTSRKMAKRENKKKWWVDGSGLGSWPMADFGISSVGHLGFAIQVFVS